VLIRAQQCIILISEDHALSNTPTASAKNETGDFDKFKDFARQIFSVPHSEIKAELDAEREAKRTSKSASPASGVPTKHT
jgi:hypothetical protein